MEAHLKPARFDTEPSSPQAAQEWQHWYTTLNNFLTVMKVTSDEDKFRLLVNFVSYNVFTYISDHKTYPDAIKALQEIYDKPKNVMYSRHLLYSTHQQSNQTLDDFLCVLKNISKDCGYKAVSAEDHRNESILSAFVSGLSSNFIRQRLLESDKLTLDTAFTQARTLDLAQRNAESYQQTPYPQACSVTSEEKSSDQGNQISAFKPNKNTGKCWFCGGKRHPRSKCPAREDTCSSCGKVGHWSKCCNSKSENTAALMLPFIPSRLSAISVADCSATSTNYSKTVLENILVNGVKAVALADSGATGNFLDELFASENKIPYNRVDYSVGLAAGSNSSNAVGESYVTLIVQNRTYENVKFSILPELVCDAILGDSFMDQHSSVEFRFGGSKPPLVLSGLPPMDMVLPPMFSDLPSNVKPIATKSRRFSLRDKSFIGEEVQRLLKSDIIEPSKSPWRAQVLVDRDEGKKPRMVIDYSRTVNQYTIPDAYPVPRIEDIVNSIAKYKRYSTFDLRTAYHQAEMPESDRDYTSFEAAGRLYRFKRLPFGLTNAVAAFQRLMDKIVEDHQLQGVYVYMDNITVVGHTQEEHDANVQRFLEVVQAKNLTLNEGKTILNVDKITLLGYEVSHQVLKPDPERVKPLLELPTPTSVPSLKRTIGLFAYYAKWIPDYSNTIRPLLQSKSMPLGGEAIKAFQTLKSVLAKAALQQIDENIPFTVETDASQYCLSATLNQNGRPVAFHSRTLTGSELHQSSVEKEAAAIVDAVRKWHHLLSNKSFTLVTDQRSVGYMFTKKHSNSVKNNKIMRWRMELAPLNYTIVYRSGRVTSPIDRLGIDT